MSAGFVKGIIPTQDLPSGILTITVFDRQWNPLAERITYINNDEYRFNAEMTVEHWGLIKGPGMKFLLRYPTAWKPVAVSVTDAAIGSDSSENIISHLLLTGDINGQVFNPSYYFSGNNDSIANQLDLVMLTHGWRRFKWEDVVKGKLPEIMYPRDSTYLTLSGKVYGATNAQLRDAATIILIVNQKSQANGNKMLMLPGHADGTFNDPSYFLFDTAQILFTNFRRDKRWLGNIYGKPFTGSSLPDACNGYFLQPAG